LDEFYVDGMTGWGKDHGRDIELAIAVKNL